MKRLPAPKVPSKAEAERFSNAFCTVLTVSKENLLVLRIPMKPISRSDGMAIKSERSDAGDFILQN